MIRSLVDFAAARFDEAVVGTLIHGSMRGRKTTARLSHAERMRFLAEFAEMYDRAEHFDRNGTFFEPPPAITPKMVRVRGLPGGEVVDATWPSACEPFCADVAPRLRSVAANSTAAARLFLHADRPRPVAILLHGYRCGQYSFEERAFPVAAFFERGLDVAIAVAPFHAVRGEGPVPLFPSNDPRITVEALRQFVFDLRALTGFLLSRGAPKVGVMGMSLGGYTTALLATIDDRLAFAIPMIPLASFADLAIAGGRFVGTDDEQRLQYEGVERVHRVVSPLARPLVVAKEHTLVVAFRGDRITPVAHAEKLAAHFGAELATFAGGHLLQFERREAFRAALRVMARAGALDPRR